MKVIFLYVGQLVGLIPRLRWAEREDDYRNQASVEIKNAQSLTSLPLNLCHIQTQG
jgi:hypothetical protein